jgi:F0F1-type ATP synthase assembly protein I
MNTLQQSIQHQAYRLVFAQLVGILLLSAAIFCLFSLKTSIFFLAGGMTYGIANIIFVTIVFRFVRASQMPLFVMMFILGEFFKLFMSGILFIVIVKTWPDSLLSALAGLFGAIVSFWFVSLWQFTGNRK